MKFWFFNRISPKLVTKYKKKKWVSPFGFIPTAKHFENRQARQAHLISENF